MEEIPQPLAVIFSEDVELEWERQQANLDSLVEETIRNENFIFNLLIMLKDGYNYLMRTLSLLMLDWFQTPQKATRWVQ